MTKRGSRVLLRMSMNSRFGFSTMSPFDSMKRFCSVYNKSDQVLTFPDTILDPNSHRETGLEAKMLHSRAFTAVVESRSISFLLVELSDLRYRVLPQQFWSSAGPLDRYLLSRTVPLTSAVARDVVTRCVTVSRVATNQEPIFELRDAVDAR
jgi:hypothetical protein